ACLLQMLVRSAGISKPAVIGDIDDPARPLVRRLQFARKNYLITDERQRAWRARRGDKAMSVAGKKPAALLRQRLEAEALQEIFERQIFSEWDEVHLVIDSANRCLVIDHIDRIVDTGLRRIVWIGKPHRPGKQQGVLRQGLRDLRERIRLARQKERKSRFRPDQVRDPIKTLARR